MRLVSGGKYGQAILWDVDRDESDSAYCKEFIIDQHFPNNVMVKPSDKSSFNGWISFAWSSDGNCLSSVQEKSNGKITLTYIRKENHASAQVSVLDNGTESNNNIKCIRQTNYFAASNSLYKNSLVIGYENKVVIFDVPRQKVQKSIYLKQYHTGESKNAFNNHVLNCLAVNRLGGGHVAVGGKDGYLRIINLVSEVSGEPLMEPHIQSITDLRFNSIKQSLLAGATESGTVALWDTNAAKRTLSFENHNAPAVGVVFSPVHASLLFSVGLDKKCLGYDVHTQDLQTTIRTEEPLTCIDFNPNGKNIALGTNSGKILLYDLRYLKKPKNVIQAYEDSAVNCLAYQTSSNHKKKDRKSSLLRETSLKNMRSEMKKDKKQESNLTDDRITSNSQIDKIDHCRGISPCKEYAINSISNTTNELFSPIGGRDNIKECYTTTDAMPKSYSTSSNSSQCSTGSIFSPLNHNSNIAKKKSTIISSKSKSPFTLNPTNDLFEECNESSDSENKAAIKIDMEPCTLSNFNPDATTSNNEKNIPINPESLLHDQHKHKPTRIYETNVFDFSPKFISNFQNQDENKSNKPLSEVFIGNQKQIEEENTKFSDALNNGTCVANDFFKQPLPPSINGFQASTPVHSNRTNILATLKEDSTPNVKSLMTAFPQAFFESFNSTFQDKKVTNRFAQNNQKVNKPALINIDRASKCINNSEKLQSEHLDAKITACIDEFSADVRRKLWHMEWNNTKNSVLIEEMSNKQEEMLKRQESLDLKIDNIDKKLDTLVSLTLRFND